MGFSTVSWAAIWILVLVDATEPFGFGRLLPRGLLREPVRNVARAHAIVLTRADLVSEPEKQSIRQRLTRSNPHAVWAETVTRPSQWIQSGGRTADLDQLRSQRLFALCAIGNPTAFRRTLEDHQFEVVETRVFPDHHSFTRDEIVSVAARAAELGCDAIVCTHKDLVKIETSQIDGLPVWAFQIDIQFLSGQQELLQLVVDRIGDGHELSPESHKQRAT